MIAGMVISAKKEVEGGDVYDEQSKEIPGERRNSFGRSRSK
jgi:hypothetical protein